jgi:hypothetical protein
MAETPYRLKRIVAPKGLRSEAETSLQRLVAAQVQPSVKAQSATPPALIREHEVIPNQRSE